MKMFNVPNLITAGNLLCGIFAIILAFAGRIDIAPYFIFAAAILDFFDGFAARLLKQHSELGKQLDSLADVISFGLAPGIILFITLIYSLWTFDKNPLLPDYTESFTVFSTLEQIVLHPSVNLSWVLISLLIPVFSMFRLAKFNIDTRQSDSFIGLPTPANTIFFMTFPLVLSSEINKTGWAHDLIIQLMNPWIIIPMILIMCYLLIAELPLFALKFKSFGWKGNEIRFIFLITCGILIFTLGWWSLAIIILLYLILSIINNILRKKTSV
ncbi:MAG: CDP-alcohol phosphatidyltransferase family protein [Fluviicola sp.]